MKRPTKEEWAEFAPVGYAICAGFILLLTLFALAVSISTCFA